MTIFMICYCTPNETILNPIHEPELHVELEVLTICANFDAIHIVTLSIGYSLKCPMGFPCKFT